jgi:4-carboxymuconolactone decarboxylase
MSCAKVPRKERTTKPNEGSVEMKYGMYPERAKNTDFGVSPAKTQGATKRITMFIPPACLEEAIVRIPEITNREDLPEDQRQFYDSIIASRKRIAAPYNFLLHAPDLAARTAHLIGYALFSTDFPNDVKELAICTVAREMDCAFEWAAHAEDALKAGVREECIKIIQDRKAPAGLTEREAEVVRYVQELLRPPHRITPATFDALKERIGVPRLVELTGILGAYVGLACSLNAFEVETPPGRPVLPL